MKKLIALLVLIISIVFVSNAAASFQNDRKIVSCLSEAGGQHIFWFNGGHRFTRIGICKYVQNIDNNTGQVTCKVALKDNPDRGFYINLTTTNKLDYTPLCSPKSPFEGSDTSAWQYYGNVIGNMTGWGAYKGVEIVLHGTGPVFQVGEGAGIHGAGEGAASWFSYTVLKNDNDADLPFNKKGSADINVEFQDCSAVKLCLPGYDRVQTFNAQIAQIIVDRGMGTTDLSVCGH